MKAIRLKVSSLFEFEGAPPAHSPDLVTITSLVSELLLVREPERRFYHECRSAGFEVEVFDELNGTEQVFDIGQLRLGFSVSRPGGPTVVVRFDPASARFRAADAEFTWSELMSRSVECLIRLR